MSTAVSQSVNEGEKHTLASAKTKYQTFPDLHVVIE